MGKKRNDVPVTDKSKVVKETRRSRRSTVTNEAAKQKADEKNEVAASTSAVVPIPQNIPAENGETEQPKTFIEPLISTASLEQHQEGGERRLSSRAIRRKKFDDEVIELVSPYMKKRGNSVSIDAQPEETVAEPEVVVQTKPQESEKVKPVKESSVVQQVKSVANSSKQDAVAPKKTASSKANAIAATQQTSAVPAVVADEEIPLLFKADRNDFPELSKFDDHHKFWTPQDDLKLILNVTHSNDLGRIHKEVQFSRDFTVENLTERWAILLYEKVTSDISIESIRQLHVSITNNIQRETIMSEDEINLLKQVPSKFYISRYFFEKFFTVHSESFLPSRKVEDLMKCYTILREKKLLNDQQDSKENDLFVLRNPPKLVMKESIASLPELKEKRHELQREFHSSVQEIRSLETEIKSLEDLISVISGVRSSEFEPETYAFLRGHHVRFLIKTKEVTLGRANNVFNVDCDLTSEGFSKKISRLQATISLLPMGKFLIFNVGTHDIVVDSKPIKQDQAAELKDGSLLEVDNLSFMFRVNKTLIMKEFSGVGKNENSVPASTSNRSSKLPLGRI